MMNLNLTMDELTFIEMLVNKAQVSTRVEIHHARSSFEYRNYLKEREIMIDNLLQKINRLRPEEQLVLNH